MQQLSSIRDHRGARRLVTRVLRWRYVWLFGILAACTDPVDPAVCSPVPHGNAAALRLSARPGADRTAARPDEEYNGTGLQSRGRDEEYNGTGLQSRGRDEEPNGTRLQGLGPDEEYNGTSLQGLGPDEEYNGTRLQAGRPDEEHNGTGLQGLRPDEEVNGTGLQGCPGYDH